MKTKIKNKIKTILSVACASIVGGTIFGVFIYFLVFELPAKIEGIPMRNWLEASGIVMIGLLVIFAFFKSLEHLGNTKSQKSIT